MILNYSSFSEHAHWWQDKTVNRSKVDAQWQPWLFSKGSLTAALVDYSAGDFRVNVLSQKWQIPFWHEQKKLGRAQHKVALVREVELIVKGVAVVFARSIIPAQALHGQGKKLAALGNNPLGHLLFNDGRMRVRKREFASIDNNQHQCYARRTPYQYMGNEILVSEFFLPSLI